MKPSPELLTIITFAILATVIAVFAIRAFASARIAGARDETAQSLARMETELGEVRRKVDAMEAMLRDV